MFDGAIEGHFERGAVAVELAQFGGGFWRDEGIDLQADIDRLYEAVDGAEAPGGVDELVAGFDLQGSLRAGGFQQIGFEPGKLFPFAGGGGEDAGGEAVPGVVARRAGLAVGCARAGGGLGVGAVGENLGGGSHGYEFLSVASI